MRAILVLTAASICLAQDSPADRLIEAGHVTARRLDETVARQIAAVDPAEGCLAMARIAGLRNDNSRQEAMLRGGTLARFHLAPEHRDAASAGALARRALDLDAGRARWGALETILPSAAHAVADARSKLALALQVPALNGRAAPNGGAN